MSSRRHNNQLPNNLPQLQNLIKRDAESYKEEFLMQLRHFEGTLLVFEISPHEFNKSLEELINFCSQVAHCYPKELFTFPSTLVNLLRKHSSVLDSEMRMSFCKALILLRYKDLLASSDLLQLFFDLLKCQDKILRKFLKAYIVNDLKILNLKHKDVKVNSTLQNFMFTMIKDSHKIAAKISLDIMIELYRKNVWQDAKTVNVISTACFSDINKLSVTAIKFFLGKDGEDEEDEEDEDELPSIKEVSLANKFNKKTKKREKFLANVKKAHQKKKKSEKNDGRLHFSALHLLHDPQGLAEKLFKKLENLKEKFEIKLLFLDFISRLIGTHQLFLLNYYPYIARFLNPHQREVMQMLQFSAQAAHELIPSEALEPIVKAIANNFITERNSAEVMAIGLNSMRELCKRCPLCCDETLLRDLAAYKTYKDKGVMMASRSLIQFYRLTYPELLHKKDRGRPTEAVSEITGKAYGELQDQGFISGAEVLSIESNGNEINDQNNESEDDNNDEYESQSDEEYNENKSPSILDKTPTIIDENCTLEDKRQRAMEVLESRFLTDADFRKIKATQIKKHVTAFAKGKKRKRREMEEKEEERNQVREIIGGGPRNELVDLSKIEMIYKKRKHDKETRMESIKNGREERESLSHKRLHSSKGGTSNKVKAKNKNFSMIKHKLKGKTKRSFVDKQRSLRQSMIRSRKFK